MLFAIQGQLYSVDMLLLLIPLLCLPSSPLIWELIADIPTGFTSTATID